MKPMKRLTDKKKALRMTLQSLPIALAAIVFIIYGATFMPSSIRKMERSVALIESISHYELQADGKPIAYFRTLSDSLSPEDWSLSADSTVTTKTYSNACWVNRWPLIPSCPGLLLTANGDSTAAKRLVSANRMLPQTLEKTVNLMKERLAQLDRMGEETDYYMRTHNVNDDGYNVMAEYSASLEARKKKVGKLLYALESAPVKKRLAMTLVTKHALVCTDTAGTVLRTACNAITPDNTKPVRLLQTADRQKPDGAKAIYPHQWLAPQTDTGDSLVIASYPGCRLNGFSPNGAKAQTFGGACKGKREHDVPPLLAPDGSPVFTARGLFIGISIGGKTVPATHMGFGLKNLLP